MVNHTFRQMANSVMMDNTLIKHGYAPQAMTLCGIWDWLCLNWKKPRFVPAVHQFWWKHIAKARSFHLPFHLPFHVNCIGSMPLPPFTDITDQDSWRRDIHQTIRRIITNTPSPSRFSEEEIAALLVTFEEVETAFDKLAREPQHRAVMAAIRRRRRDWPPEPSVSLALRIRIYPEGILMLTGDQRHRFLHGEMSDPEFFSCLHKFNDCGRTQSTADLAKNSRQQQTDGSLDRDTPSLFAYQTDEPHELHDVEVEGRSSRPHSPPPETGDEPEHIVRHTRDGTPGDDRCSDGQPPEPLRFGRMGSVEGVQSVDDRNHEVAVEARRESRALLGGGAFEQVHRVVAGTQQSTPKRRCPSPTLGTRRQRGRGGDLARCIEHCFTWQDCPERQHWHNDRRRPGALKQLQ
jgi:hypothetical protein